MSLYILLFFQLTCIVTSLSPTITSLVRKSAPANEKKKGRKLSTVAISICCGQRVPSNYRLLLCIVPKTSCWHIGSSEMFFQRCYRMKGDRLDKPTRYREQDSLALRRTAQKYNLKQHWVQNASNCVTRTPSALLRSWWFERKRILEQERRIFRRLSGLVQFDAWLEMNDSPAITKDDHLLSR
jgi:hypothetical protein